MVETKNGKWSIPTKYKNIQMRSKLETKWAKFFDKNKIKWLYEPEGFEKDGVKYLPDFALPDLKIIFEVKGVMDDNDEKKKQIMAEICEEKKWKYVMGFSEIPAAFLMDSFGNEFKIEISIEKESRKHKKSFENDKNKQVTSHAMRLPEQVIMTAAIKELRAKELSDAFEMPIKELMVLYLFHPTTRPRVEELFNEYKFIMPESCNLFFKDVRIKFKPDDAVDYLKDYFTQPQIKYFISQFEIYERPETFNEIISDNELKFKRRKLKEELKVLDSVLQNSTGEERKRLLIERMEFAKVINNLVRS